jgi:hypothetical protein
MTPAWLQVRITFVYITTATTKVKVFWGILTVRNFNVVLWLWLIYNFWYCPSCKIFWPRRITRTCSSLLTIILFGLHWIIWAYLGSMNSWTLHLTRVKTSVFVSWPWPQYWGNEYGSLLMKEKWSHMLHGGVPAACATRAFFLWWVDKTWRHSLKLEASSYCPREKFMTLMQVAFSNDFRTLG